MKKEKIMKRLAALLFILICIFALGSCSNFDHTSKDDEKDEVAPTISKYLREEEGKSYLTLPKTGKTVEIEEKHIAFKEKITDALVEEAEQYILSNLSEEEKGGEYFYLKVKNGKLCLAAEVIRELDPPKPHENSKEFEDHEHVFYDKAITD